MDEKKVRLGVDPGDTESAIKRLKSSTDELFRGMISSSRAYSTSAREVLSDLENQIRAIEKRNRLEAEGRRVDLQSRYERGEVTEAQLRTGKQQIISESREDKLQTQLLRELIDTVKSQAKEEIRADRENVEKRIQASKTVGERGPRGDEKEILKETIQEYELGKMQQEEIQQRGMFERGRRGLPYLSTIAGSSSIYEATAGVAQTGFGRVSQAGGAMAFLGGLGVIAAMAGGRAIQASLPYEQALGRYAGIAGGDMSSYEGFGRGYSAYGYTMDQTLARRYSIARARGTTAGAGQATLDALLMERGLSLDPAMIDQLERMQRGEQSGYSTRGNVQGVIGTMRGVGAIQGGDMSKVPEYLEIIASLGNEQLKRLGSVDTGVNVKLMAGISTLDKSFQNPEYLKEIVTSIRTGLVSAPNKQTEALQLSLLSSMNPTMGIGALMAERERGAYGQEYLGKLRDISGGSTDVFQANIASMFPGISQTTARKIAMGDMSEWKRITSQAFTVEGGVNLEARAGGATGALQSNMAAWTNSFMQTGEDLIKAFDEFKASLGESVEAAKGLIDQANQLTTSNKDLIKMLDISFNPTGGNYGATLLSFIVAKIRQELH